MGKWMNEAAAVLGIVTLIGGIGLGVWATDQADNMGFTRIVYPEQYES